MTTPSNETTQPAQAPPHQLTSHSDSGVDGDAFEKDSHPSEPTSLPSDPTSSMEKGTENQAAAAGGPPPVADGGLAAWAAVLGAALILFCTFGYANAFGVFQSYYRLNQLSNETDSNISWIGSIQLWLQFTCGVISGPLYDKGYCKALIAVGSVLYVFSLFMTSLCKTFWQVILAQGIGMGLAMGLIFLPAITVLSQHFAKRRSFAMGIAVSGSSLGGVCFPIMLNNLFVSHGFEYGVRASAYVVLACLAVANVVITAPAKPRVKGPNEVKPNPADFFKEIKYTSTVLGGFFVAWGIFFPIFYLQVLAEINGVSQKLSFYSLSILNGASMFGRTLPNLISDKFGPFTMIVPCCTVACVLIFAMFGATNPGGVIVFAILYGFFSGAYVSLLGPVMISLARNVHEIGMRIGIGFMVIGLAALTGTPIAGALLTRTHQSFYAPIIFSGLSVAVGTVLFAAGRVLQARHHQSWKV